MRIRRGRGGVEMVNAAAEVDFSLGIVISFYVKTQTKKQLLEIRTVNIKYANTY